MAGNHLGRIETLTKDNYDTWKMQVEALLQKNDLWEYVDGTSTRPTPVRGTEGNAQAVATWDSNDRKAKADLVDQSVGVEASKELHHLTGTMAEARIHLPVQWTCPESDAAEETDPQENKMAPARLHFCAPSSD